MSNEWFDKNLEDRFNDMPAGLNLEDAWNRLEKTRKKKKNRKGLFLFWIGAGIATLLGLALVFWYTASEPPSMPQALNSSEKQQEATSIVPTLSNEIPENVSAQVQEIYLANPGKTIAKSNVQNSGNTIMKVDPINQDVSSILKEILQPPQNQIIESELPLNKAIQTAKGVPGLPLLFFEVRPDKPKPAPLAAAGYLAEPINLSRKGQILVIGSYGPSQLKSAGPNTESVDRLGLGLYCQGQLSPRLYWRTGLAYTRIADRLFFTQTVESQQEEDMLLLEIRKLQDGTVEEVFGPGMVSVVETTTANIWRFRESISLPVEMGWQFISRSRTQAGVFGGLGLKHWLSQSESPTVTLDARLGLDLHHLFGQRTSLIAGIEVGQDLQGSLAYRWINGRIGLKYNLF